MPPVLRSPSFAGVMARLALVAMLLIALAPTVSRALQEGGGAPAGPVMQALQMCTSSGLQVRAVSPWTLGASQSDGGAPAAHAHGGGDACGYCSIVVPLPLLVLLLCGLLLPLPRAPAFRSRVVRARFLRNARSLGAQAPPLVL